MQLYLDTIHAYAAAINTLNAEGFAACFAEDSELYDPANGEPFRGPAGALAFFAQFEPLLESIHITPGEIRINGNHAAFTWRLEATGKTGRTAAADGIDAMVFDESGKIKAVHAYWNAGPFVAKLMDS
jgi:ketosteroid isomerase-like protein